MVIRASALKIGSIYLIHPRLEIFKKLSAPPPWMWALSCIPGVQLGFIDSSGRFIDAEQAHLYAFCSGQLEDEATASGTLSWEMLKW